MTVAPPHEPSAPFEEDLPSTNDTSEDVQVEPYTGPPRAVVDVLCDETGRLGALSYFVPTGLDVRPGDAVHVPFGKRELHGMVVGPGNAERATRQLIRVYGKRVSESDLILAHKIAERYFSDFNAVASRLSPRSGRGHDALDMGPVKVLDPVVLPAADQLRRLYVRPPLLDPARLAASEALRLSARGQVLVLCPTVELLEATLAQFESGAARLDTKAPSGAWSGLALGTLKVGIGTRAAALYSAKDLAGIIVVEEDHPGHLEATQPYTNARDVASFRATWNRCALTLVSATPTAAGMGAKVKVILAGDRTGWPSVRVLDRSEYPPAERLVPPPLRAAIDRALRSGQRVVVLAEKRKAVRRCTRCSEPRPCPECTKSTCRHQEATACPRCQATTVRMVGWDAPRLRELLGAGVEALTIASLGDPSLFDSSALVILFDIDAALSSPGFSPESLASHLVTSAASAAGSGGSVFVLTRQADHPLILTLCARKDQLSVAKRLWAAAKAAGLPPFGRLVTVRSGQVKPPRVDTWPGRVHGPKKVGSEWEVLVRLTDADLPRMARALTGLRRGGKIRITLS